MSLFDRWSRRGSQILKDPPPAGAGMPAALRRPPMLPGANVVNSFAGVRSATTIIEGTK